ncbi:hypothetical protein BJ508DRAFT_366506 [Ascobolus immersus RN42]|uniref:Uncharacterized protein n=1 Tax=Ascobolus immersus RN42 TaxID=1160509 RepID=A0A3N4HKX2_ASCIM|nr:hypothetical protein BJ508DRAFT_366506 [Ascobolus immersus RN42]
MSMEPEPVDLSSTRARESGKESDSEPQSSDTVDGGENQSDSEVNPINPYSSNHESVDKGSSELDPMSLPSEAAQGNDGYSNLDYVSECECGSDYELETEIDPQYPSVPESVEWDDARTVLLNYFMDYKKHQESAIAIPTSDDAQLNDSKPSLADRIFEKLPETDKFWHLCSALRLFLGTLYFSQTLQRLGLGVLLHDGIGLNPRNPELFELDPTGSFQSVMKDPPPPKYLAELSFSGITVRRKLEKRQIRVFEEDWRGGSGYPQYELFVEFTDAHTLSLDLGKLTVSDSRTMSPRGHSSLFLESSNPRAHSSNNNKLFFRIGNYQ